MLVTGEEAEGEAGAHGVAGEVKRTVLPQQGSGEAVDFVFEALDGERQVGMVAGDGRTDDDGVRRQLGEHGVPRLGATGEAV